MTTYPNIRSFFSSKGDTDDLPASGTGILRLAIDYRFIRYFIEHQGQILFYGDYALHSVSDIAEVAEHLSNILSKDSTLSRNFDSVRICWGTDFEIIPSVFFDTDDLSSDTSVTDILNHEACFIFETPAPIRQVLDTKFSAYLNFHTGAALIECIRHSDMTQGDKLFVNIYADKIEVVSFDSSGGLRLYNQYAYKTYQDYIYYLLLVANELALDRETAQVILMGEISQDSKIYEMTYLYFRHLSFMEPANAPAFIRTISDYSAHFNYPFYTI